MGCVDKISFITNTFPNLEALRAMSKETESIRNKGRYWMQALKFTLRNNARVFVYEGKVKGQTEFRIEYNPNHFSGWKASIELIELMFGGVVPEHKVVEIHFNVDLLAKYEAVKASIYPTWFRNVKIFTVFETIKSGKRTSRELRFGKDAKKKEEELCGESLYFGTERKKIFNIYDHQVRHGGSSARTRCEIRYFSNDRYREIKHIGDSLPMLAPFKGINFYSSGTDLPDNGMDWVKATFFDLLVQKYSLKVAKQMIRKHVSKADRASTFGKVFKRYRKRRFDLNDCFHRSAKRFVKTSITKDEARMFASGRI